MAVILKMAGSTFILNFIVTNKSNGTTLYPNKLKFLSLCMTLTLKAFSMIALMVSKLNSKKSQL